MFVEGIAIPRSTESNKRVTEHRGRGERGRESGGLGMLGKRRRDIDEGWSSRKISHGKRERMKGEEGGGCKASRVAVNRRRRVLKSEL